MRTGPPPLSERRSYIGTAFVLVGATLLPVALVCSWLMAAVLGRAFGDVLPFGLGIAGIVGLSCGLIGAFFLKVETAIVEFADRKGFISRLNVATSQLGYNPATQIDAFFTYKPSFQAGLPAGRISVQLHAGQAIIVGPKWYVNRLVKRLTAD